MNGAGFTGALIGGLLIGSAALLLLLFNGRVAGISTITGKLFFSVAGERLWRILFLLGLIVGARIAYLTFGNLPLPRENFPMWLLGLSGFLVGYGTALGSGCTSGHGVCGLGRLSLRSLVATCLFLITGIVTTVVVRHVFGVLS